MSSRRRRIAVGRLAFHAVAVLCLVTSLDANAAECSVEAIGQLIDGGLSDSMPRLVDPRCFVQTRSATTTIAIVDGRIVEEQLGFPPSATDYVKISLVIRDNCSDRSPLVRRVPGRLQVISIFRHAIGAVERTEREVEVHMICRATTTEVAAASGNLLRLVVSFPSKSRRLPGDSGKR